MTLPLIGWPRQRDELLIRLDGTRGLSRGTANLPIQMFRPDAIRGMTVSQPGTVDYRLARQALVSEFRKKRLAQHEVCDAHPELVRAARECGEPTSIECPICEAANVVLVSYVFGPRLPAFGRCITSKDELAKLSRRSDQLADSEQPPGARRHACRGDDERERAGH